MSMFGQNNFLIRHQYQDFFSDVQRNSPRVGEVGKVSDDFKDRAYKQFHDHTYHALAQRQDSFIAPDEIDGTRGRDKNRNLKRMEYDEVERHDGKEHAQVMDEVNKKVELSVDNILNAFKKQGFTLCSTATAIGAKPVEQKDYEGQINLDR